MDITILLFIGDKMLRIYVGKTTIDNGIYFPEAGKHPDEIFEEAKEQVLDSQNKDIDVVTYSSILIESFDVWSKWEKIPIEFYLNGKKIPSDYLYDIYDELAKVYDEINVLRLRIERRNEDDK